MATRIVHLEFDADPADVSLEGCDRLWVVAWRNAIPVGATLVESEGEGELSRERLRRALEAVQPGETPMDTPSPLPSISVIICTRNRPDELPIVLEALRAQSIRDFELVIVDNAPEDGRTHRVVQEHWPDARYVVEPVPGLPRARNTGVRACSGQVCAFTDDDCQPAPRWVESILRNFASDPEVGCVTGPILPRELDTPAQEAMESRGGFNRGFNRAVYTLETEDGPVHPVQAWKFGAGGSMALSRRCLDEVGGFDEALSRSEDMDIFYQALRAGYSLVFEPGTAVRHRHLPEWSDLRRRLFHWGWGYLTYLDKISRLDSSKYAERAKQERRNWMRYQLKDRVLACATGRADLPLSLVLREVAGGLIGYRGYPLAKAAAARRESAAARASVESDR